MGDTWYLDEVFVTVHGRRQYLWRAVDQDGDLLDILVQSRRDRHAAVRFFRKVMKGQDSARPTSLITDKRTKPLRGALDRHDVRGATTHAAVASATARRSRINRRDTVSDLDEVGSNHAVHGRRQYLWRYTWTQ